MKTGSFYIFLLIISIAGCREKESSEKFSLNAEQFEKGISENSEKVILDVRTPDEFNEGHIRNAVLANFNGNDFKDQIDKLDKNIPVYVYCASGVRSDKAATMMRANGFEKVYVLAEGLNEWRTANKEIVK
ncbi:MAG TPA: rhodanese-like domain-containing protein [Chryseosolibacter sp.]